MSVPTATRRLEWDAAHRIPRHESKCAALHGHRYVAEITCAADQLDDRGRVVDFGVVKELVGGWVDQHWDHTALFMRGDSDPSVQAVAISNAAHGRRVYWMDNPPTAENMASELAGVAQRLLQDRGLRVVHVRLYETPNCWADWRAV